VREGLISRRPQKRRRAMAPGKESRFMRGKKGKKTFAREGGQKEKPRHPREKRQRGAKVLASLVGGRGGQGASPKRWTLAAPKEKKTQPALWRERKLWREKEEAVCSSGRATRMSGNDWLRSYEKPGSVGKKKGPRSESERKALSPKKRGLHLRVREKKSKKETRAVALRGEHAAQVLAGKNHPRRKRGGNHDKKGSGGWQNFGRKLSPGSKKAAGEVRGEGKRKKRDPFSKRKGGSPEKRKREKGSI